MRKASIVLGLIGDTIDILVALLIISGAVAFNIANNMKTTNMLINKPKRA